MTPQRPAWEPLTTVRFGEVLVASPHTDLMRLAIQFADDFRGAVASTRLELVRQRPEPTGDAHADALIAGLVEHLCHLNGVPAPAWVEEPDRFLDRWWLLDELPGLWALALLESPAALRRRGIFTTEGTLASV